MKKKILIIAVVVLPALLSAGESVDLFGNWIAKESGGWPPGETIFSFKPEGTKLTGTVSDPQGETAIRDGKIIGDEISFFVIGGFGRKLFYKGKVSLNEIKFTVEEQDSREQPREFIAKREFQRNQDIPLRPQSEPPPVRVPRR